MGGKVHVGLEVIEVVTHQVGNDTVLFGQLVFKILDTPIKSMDLLFQDLDLSKLRSLHDHHIVHMVHRIVHL